MIDEKKFTVELEGIEEEYEAPPKGEKRLKINITGKDNAPVDGRKEGNTIVIGKTDGKESHVGSEIREYSLAIGETIGEEAHVGKKVGDYTVVIGRTRGHKACVGYHCEGDNIIIGNTVNAEAHVGGEMMDAGIAIGRTRASRSDVGEYMRNQCLAIGMTKGKNAHVGENVTNNVLVIGKTRKKGSYVGANTSRRGLAIGFEIDEKTKKEIFVIKSNTKYRIKETNFSGPIKKLSELIDKVLELSDKKLLKNVKIERTNRDKWKTEMDLLSDLKPGFIRKDEEGEYIVKIGGKLQVHPIENISRKNPLNIAFLKQVGAYENIQEMLLIIEKILKGRLIHTDYWMKTLNVHKKRFGLKCEEVEEVQMKKSSEEEFKKKHQKWKKGQEEADESDKRESEEDKSKGALSLIGKIFRIFR